MCLHLVPSIHIRVLISFYKDTSHIVAAVYWIRANPNFWVSLVAQIIKKMPAMWETWVRSLSWEGSWRRAWQPTPVFLPRESPWTEELGGL